MRVLFDGLEMTEGSIFGACPMSPIQVDAQTVLEAVAITGCPYGWHESAQRLARHVQSQAQREEAVRRVVEALDDALDLYALGIQANADCEPMNERQDAANEADRIKEKCKQALAQFRAGGET